MGKLSIKEWAEEDRPREKLLLKGPSALSNSELLAILIGSGNREMSAVELGKRILQQVGNDLNLLGKMDVSDFTRQFKGIGPAKAVTLIAALELGRRRKSIKGKVRKKISSSRDGYHFLFPILLK